MTSIAQRDRCIHGQGGFTIIELMTVVIVIGILAVIVIPNYVKFADRAKEALVKENMHVLHTGMEMFSIQNLGTYPQQADEAALEDLMPRQSFPTNPFDNNVTEIVWDANPGNPGEISISGLANGGYEIRGRGRERVLDVVITAGD